MQSESSVSLFEINGYIGSLFYQLDAQVLYFNTFITFLYMFRALLCSSSGEQITLTQHLVPSLWEKVSGLN